MEEEPLSKKIGRMRENIEQLKSSSLTKKTIWLELLLGTTTEKFCLFCGLPRLDFDPTGLTCGNKKCLLGLSVLMKEILEQTKKIGEELAIDCKDEKIKRLFNEFNLFLFIHSKVQDLIRMVNGLADDLGLDVNEDPVETLTEVYTEIKLIIEKTKGL